MVKLIFNPKEKNGNQPVISLSSKKKEVNLNPFQNVEPIKPAVVEKEPELTLKSLAGLENCAYVLNEWYNKKSNKLLLLVGPVGCGKTTLVELYCKENDIQLYTVRPSENIKTKKDLLKDLIAFSQYSSTSFFKQYQFTKKLILIDEYQNGQSDLLNLTDINTLLLLNNRVENKKEIGTFLTGVCDFNSEFTLPPILIISSDSKGSKLSDIKKTQEVYYINEIPFNTIKQWINSFKFEISDELLTEIVKKCKSDKRLLLNTLEFLKQNKNADNFMNTFYKDVDINIFECISILFENSDLDILEIFKMYDTDGFLLSNLVFENYLDYSTDIHKVANASEAISFGETIFSDTYESNKSFIPDAHCINSLCIPRYYLQSDIPNKNIRSCSINNRYNIYLNNSKILNKINLNIFDIHFLKIFLNQSLVKTKVLTVTQELFLKNILNSLNGSQEKLELIYKHFSDFSGKQIKTKTFTLKFKEKLTKLNTR
jgi:DNA polymerase III delta prime subunit